MLRRWTAAMFREFPQGRGDYPLFGGIAFSAGGFQFIRHAFHFYAHCNLAFFFAVLRISVQWPGETHRDYYPPAPEGGGGGG